MLTDYSLGSVLPLLVQLLTHALGVLVMARKYRGGHISAEHDWIVSHSLMRQAPASAGHTSAPTELDCHNSVRLSCRILMP